MKEEKTMIVEKAEHVILEQVRRTAPETLPLLDALGLVASEDVLAPMDIPPFSMSTVDGYAVASAASKDATADKPARLRVVGTALAGAPCRIAMGEREAVRIMTGAGLPEGADSVVMFEDCVASQDEATILAPVAGGGHVRPAGSDKKKGDLVVPKDKTLRAIDVEALASMGMREVAAYKRPAAAVITTGNELIAIDGRLEAGKTVQSNGYLIAARFRELNAAAVIRPPVEDDAGAIRAAVLTALDADLVVITGGSSKGDHDHVRDALRAMGTIHVAGVAVRPGGSFAFATVKGKPVFSLPGSPSACLVLFELFIRPCVNKMLGKSRFSDETVRAESLGRFPKASDRRRYVGASLRSLRGRKYAAAGPARSFGTLIPMVGQNSLVIVHENAPRIAPGDPVDVRVLYPEDVEEIPCESALPREVVRGAAAPVVSFVGKSNSGKTTLLEKVIRELVGRGYRIGTVKHDAHRFEIDTPGKDSFRHRAAGSKVVVISSNDKIAAIEGVTAARTLDELVEPFVHAVDLFLTEGFKRSGKPKVEVCRSERSRTLICSPQELLAVASDMKFDVKVPQFDIDDAGGLADFLEDRFLQRGRAGAP